jgi:hypothetical protein
LPFQIVAVEERMSALTAYSGDVDDEFVLGDADGCVGRVPDRYYRLRAGRVRQWRRNGPNRDTRPGWTVIRPGGDDPPKHAGVSTKSANFTPFPTSSCGLSARVLELRIA